MFRNRDVPGPAITARASAPAPARGLRLGAIAPGPASGPATAPGTPAPPGPHRSKPHRRTR